MTKVTLGMNVSLDGYVARPDGALDWMFPNIDRQRTTSIVESLSRIDVFLMGRVTYEGMAAHWPNAGDEIAPLMNRAEKVVFSRTLDSVGWTNCRLATSDPATEIAALKREPGKRIAVAGGARFAQSLSREGLIDEYSLTIHPVALGTGMPLFSDPINLELLSRECYATGAMQLVYRPA